MDEMKEQRAGGAAPDLAERMEAAAAQEAESASFTVVREKVKRRPVKWGKWLRRAGLVLFGGVLFGLIAAYSFTRFLPLFQEPEKPEPIEIAHDPTPVPEVTAAPTPHLTPLPTPLPTPIPTPEEEVTPEEQTEARIEEHRQFYADLRTVTAGTIRSLVIVTGVSSADDWSGGTYEDREERVGFIVADAGSRLLIVTDQQAVDGTDQVITTFSDGTVAECALIKMDPNTGLCVISADKSAFEGGVPEMIKAAALGNSYIIKQGDPTIAAGAPMGEHGAVSFGQITSMELLQPVVDGEYPLINTNIPATENGSGVLLNLSGEIVGLISQKYSRTGGNVVTALPISQLKPLIETLSNNEPLAWLGIMGENVTEAAAEGYGLPVGIYVTDVEEDSPAFNAGIRRGDIIGKIGDRDSLTMTILGAVLGSGIADTDQELTILRLGAEGYVEIPLTVHIGAI